MDKIVGIGEYAITNGGNDRIRTHALASCVAVTVFSPKSRAAGMVHIALPSHGKGDGKDPRPCYYADTAIPLLIGKICEEFGCRREDLVIKLYGGAKSVRQKDIFNIGERNIHAVKSALDGFGLKYSAAEVGGTNSRTLEMETATGAVKVSMQPIII